MVQIIPEVLEPVNLRCFPVDVAHYSPTPISNRCLPQLSTTNYQLPANVSVIDKNKNGITSICLGNKIVRILVTISMIQDAFIAQSDFLFICDSIISNPIMMLLLMAIATSGSFALMYGLAS